MPRFSTQPAAPPAAVEGNFPSDPMHRVSGSSAVTQTLEELCRDTVPTVYLIDDDPGIRDALSLLLALKNLRVLAFANAEDFLAADRPETNACILLDIRLPGMGGLELQRTLIARGDWTPVIIMTGNPNVAASRTAFKSGAVDFLQKPIPEAELIEALSDAIRFSNLKQQNTWTRLENNSALSGLTAREREVLNLLVSGSSSREVAQKLTISHRTVEVYKSRMMDKLGVRKLTDLVRLALLPPSENALKS